MNVFFMWWCIKSVCVIFLFFVSACVCLCLWIFMHEECGGTLEVRTVRGIDSTLAVND